MGRAEKYILDVILNKNLFDENKFKQEILKEAQEKLLITNKKYSIVPRMCIIILIAIILLIITYKINLYVFVVYTTVALTSLYIYFYASAVFERTLYKRTKDGKKLAILFKGLKRYIREYTLIKDKNINYIQILEDYIPYALSLGEADAVEEFIKKNEKYRNLIYNKF